MVKVKSDRPDEGVLLESMPWNSLNKGEFSEKENNNWWQVPLL